MLVELNVFFCCCSGRFSFIPINHLNCVEICMFLSKSQKFYLPSGRSVTQFLFWNLEVREKFDFILPKRKGADLHSQSSLKVSIHETSRRTIDKTEQPFIEILLLVVGCWLSFKLEGRKSTRVCLVTVLKSPMDTWWMVYYESSNQVP